MEDKKNNMDNEKFIIKYTNKEIYTKLEQIHKDIGSLNTKVAETNGKIDVTNGKVKLHTKIIVGICTAIGTIFMLIFRLHANGG